MMQTKKLATAAAATPVTLDNLKDHLRVTTDDENQLLENLISAATEQAQGLTGRALITQTWEYYLDRWPVGSVIEMPLPPLQSVTSIQYTDRDGNTSTFDSASYSVDTVSYIGRVVLNEGYSWPSTALARTNPIKITFVAGYGDNPEDVPQSLQQAVLLLAGHFYEYRDLFITGTIISDVPYSAQALLDQYTAKGL